MIEINNLTKDKISEDLLKKVAEKVLEEENVEIGNLSIALVNSNRIKELNKLYRGKDKETDVLSFKYDNIKEQDGEIVLCLEQIEKNAKINDSSLEEELTRVLIHGILHLLGYDHEDSVQQEKIMQEKEDYYLLQMKTIL